MKQGSAIIRENEKKHKKPTSPYWTFSILSSKELESSLSHKAILCRTIEKQIWRLGAALLKMTSFWWSQRFHTTHEKRSCYERFCCLPLTMEDHWEHISSTDFGKTLQKPWLESSFIYILQVKCEWMKRWLEDSKLLFQKAHLDSWRMR